jgi:hypothetical protein
MNVIRIATGLLLACAAHAQLPRVGDINFYGLRKLTPNQILEAAHFGPGDKVPASRVVVEDRLTALPEVMEAQVQSVCCAGDHTTLFIGIRERGEPDIEFRSAPDGKDALPEDLMTRYRKYSGELLRSGMNGSTDPAIRRDQEFFRLYAVSHTLKLRGVLHNAADEEQRAAAATVTADEVNKKTAVDDLLFALQDPDQGVRTNALRALAGLADTARRQPALGIRISPAQVVDLLNSVALSDRTEATKALLAMTERANAAVFDLIRERALPSLAEMARWETKSYAQPPFQLLGRVAGLKDEQASQSWDSGDRETVIQQALDSAAQRKGANPPGLQ